MKLLIVPDVHGSTEWKKVKSIPKESYDYVVFLGDYFDSWKNKWPEQGDVVRELFSWVREDTEHRKALIGNHDFSYWSNTRDGSGVSGHQYNKSLEIRKILEDNVDIIDLAVEFDGWVMSHAGFTKTWVSYLLHFFHQEFDKWPDEYYKPEFFESKEQQESFMERMREHFVAWEESEFSVKFLNNYWHNSFSHDPHNENYRIAFEELLDWHGAFSGSGDEVMQGPLWVRPSSLLRDAYYPNQIVGHTEMCVGEPVCLKSKNGKVLVADSSNHELIFIFDTENPGNFITEPEYNRQQKSLNKAIGRILSMKLRDEDAIRNELLNGGSHKGTQLDTYVNYVKDYWKKNN